MFDSSRIVWGAKCLCGNPKCEEYLKENRSRPRRTPSIKIAEYHDDGLNPDGGNAAESVWRETKKRMDYSHYLFNIMTNEKNSRPTNPLGGFVRQRWRRNSGGTSENRRNSDCLCNNHPEDSPSESHMGMKCSYTDRDQHKCPCLQLKLNDPNVIRGTDKPNKNSLGSCQCRDCNIFDEPKNINQIDCYCNANNTDSDKCVCAQDSNLGYKPLPFESLFSKWTERMTRIKILDECHTQIDPADFENSKTTCRTSRLFSNKSSSTNTYNSDSDIDVCRLSLQKGSISLNTWWSESTPTAVSFPTSNNSTYSSPPTTENSFGGRSSNNKISKSNCPYSTDNSLSDSLTTIDNSDGVNLSIIENSINDILLSGDCCGCPNAPNTPSDSSLNLDNSNSDSSVVIENRDSDSATTTNNSIRDSTPASVIASDYDAEHSSKKMVPMEDSAPVQQTDSLQLIKSKISTILFSFYSAIRRAFSSISSQCWSVKLTMILFLVVAFSMYTEACSSRSTPKPRPATTNRPTNIISQRYDCPFNYAAWYCLNKSKCFTVKIRNSLLYNCECADGYVGPRCEYKDLDGIYEASIAGGATFAVVFVVLILFILYLCHYKDREHREKEIVHSSVLTGDGSHKIQMVTTVTTITKPYNHNNNKINNNYESADLQHIEIIRSSSHITPNIDHKDTDAILGKKSKKAGLPFHL